MGDLTEHFNWAEFHAQAVSIPPCYRDNIREVARRLELLRSDLGNKPITVHSGYRTPEQNRLCGGVKASQHLVGKAADISVDGVQPRIVAHYARLHFNGVGHYSTFTHCDIRGDVAEWWG
jgi:uncharacterized protein YcbK (DUF882 family)